MNRYSLDTAFEAPFLLGNAHAQTIVGAVLRRLAPLPLTRERFELGDGDFLDLDRTACPSPTAPWVLVLHGLEGSSSSPYAKGIAGSLLAAGIEAILINYRGCSGEPNRLARGYTLAETADVKLVLEKLARERPGRPFGLVGFSTGANITMKLLGESGENAPPLAAGVAISAPFDVARTAAHLDGIASWHYRQHLLRPMRVKALAKIARFPGIADPRAIERATTFSAFDESWTAPVHGFKNAEDYWTVASGGRYLGGVARDLLVISAEDDPFFPRGYVPVDALRKNPKIQLALAPKGGHCGFVSGSLFKKRYWAEELAVSYFLQAFSRVASAQPREAAPAAVSS